MYREVGARRLIYARFLTSDTRIARYLSATTSRLVALEGRVQHTRFFLCNVF